MKTPSPPGSFIAWGRGLGEGAVRTASQGAFTAWPMPLTLPSPPNKSIRGRGFKPHHHLISQA